MKTMLIGASIGQRAVWIRNESRLIIFCLFSCFNFQSVILRKKRTRLKSVSLLFHLLFFLEQQANTEPELTRNLEQICFVVTRIAVCGALCLRKNSRRAVTLKTLLGETQKRGTA